MASWRGSRASKERSASRAPRPCASRCLGLLAASFDGERRRAQPRPDRTDVLLVSLCSVSLSPPARPAVAAGFRGPRGRKARGSPETRGQRGRAAVDISNAAAGPSNGRFFFGKSDFLKCELNLEFCFKFNNPRGDPAEGIYLLATPSVSNYKSF